MKWISELQVAVLQYTILAAVIRLKFRPSFYLERHYFPHGGLFLKDTVCESTFTLTSNISDLLDIKRSSVGLARQCKGYDTGMECKDI